MRRRFDEKRVGSLYDQRERIYAKQLGRCADCGRIYRSHQEMEMAHRLAESEANIRAYGYNVIDHDLNKGLVCREKWAGHDCNSALLLDGKPAIARALVREIQRVIKEDGGGE